ncbi:MAG: DUF4469 domain-containing protein [Bacteroidales bacterium]|nr:DUF4469 domain-containing protein [Bacteroidales bacterium]
MLKYALVENAMAVDPNSCVAIVSSPERKNLDDVINFMIAEGTGLTRPQALAYFEKLTQTVLYFVGEGHSVITPLVRVRPTVSGIFTDKRDNFDSSRHQVNIRSTSGFRLRDLETHIKLEKVNVATQIPVPEIFTDALTGEDNFWATSGGLGVLKGQLLKFDPEDVQQGVFFVPVNNPAVEIRAGVYSGIKPSEVHFQVPTLESGEYSVIVKSIPKTGKGLKRGELETVVNVG